MSPTPHSKLVRRHTEAAQLEIFSGDALGMAPLPLRPWLGANLGLFPVSAESENWYVHCGIRESLPHYSLLYLRLPSLR